MRKLTKITGEPWKIIEGIQVYLTEGGMFEARRGEQVLRGRNVPQLIASVRKVSKGIPSLIVRRDPYPVKAVEITSAVKPDTRYYTIYRDATGAQLHIDYQQDVYIADPAILNELESLYNLHTEVCRKWAAARNRLVPLTPERFNGSVAAQLAEEIAAETAANKDIDK